MNESYVGRGRGVEAIDRYKRRSIARFIREKSDFY